jgi:pimeloyl-ACP methyl ester carboxylesterase
VINAKSIVMRKNEKQSFTHAGRDFLFVISVLLLSAISCQQDEIFSDPVSDAAHPYLLKSNEIPCDEGDFCGDYKGGLWQISLPGPPEFWNNVEYILGIPRVMVFYAHGLSDPCPYEEIKFPDDVIGTIPVSVKQIIKGMGMGYATTSYRDNGLVVLDAIKDIQQLTIVVKKFFLDHPEYYPPDYLILGGPSEGGLVTVKTIEKYPQLFDGGISICGPIGSFAHQLQHNGDFHVLFNYFFKPELEFYGIDLGSPEGVPQSTMDAWAFGGLQTVLGGIITSELMIPPPNRVTQLLTCAGLDISGIPDPYTMGITAIQLLRYNIMLTNDVIERMKGVPFSNIGKVYEGSLDDEALNDGVERIQATSYKRATNFVKQFETTGKIAVPLAIIHTTGDHVTPFWHQEGYASKIFPQSSDLLCRIDVENYGHCTIEVYHIAAALNCIAGKIGFDLEPALAELSQK